MWPRSSASLAEAIILYLLEWVESRVKRITSSKSIPKFREGINKGPKPGNTLLAIPSWQDNGFDFSYRYHRDPKPVVPTQQPVLFLNALSKNPLAHFSLRQA